MGSILLIIQTIYIIKAFKEEKQLKWWKGLSMSWLLSLPKYRKSSGKTTNAASVKKALAMSQPIFMPKSSILSSQGQFCERSITQTMPRPHSVTSNGCEGKKWSASLPICQITPRQTFSLSERWNRSWQNFRCPRAASWWTWRGSSGPSAKTSPLPTFSSRWTAAKCTSESALTRPKKVPKQADF